jgi:hypothetical protein
MSEAIFGNSRSASLGSLTESNPTFAGIARPVFREQSRPRISVKGRMRPITNALDVAMLDGVEVNVIHVAGEIIFVANRVLPVASLPQSQFSIGVAGYVDTRMQ